MCVRDWVTIYSSQLSGSFKGKSVKGEKGDETVSKQGAKKQKKTLHCMITTTKSGEDQTIIAELQQQL